ETGELSRNEEGLREELLDLTSAGDDQLVVFGEFVHAQDRDDILKIFVTLQDLLHVARYLIVLLADNLRSQDTRGRVERIDGRINAKFRDLTRKNGGRVQVSEGSRRRGVGQVVGRNVNGLNRRDGTLRRRGDAFLQFAQVGGKGWLVTD